MLDLCLWLLFPSPGRCWELGFCFIDYVGTEPAEGLWRVLLPWIFLLALMQLFSCLPEVQESLSCFIDFSQWILVHKLLLNQLNHKIKSPWLKESVVFSVLATESRVSLYTVIKSNLGNRVLNEVKRMSLLLFQAKGDKSGFCFKKLCVWIPETLMRGVITVGQKGLWELIRVWGGLAFH